MFASGVASRLRSAPQHQKPDDDQIILSARSADDIVCALTRDDPQAVLAVFDADIVHPNARIPVAVVCQAPCAATNVLFDGREGIQHAVDYGPLANRNPTAGITPLEIAILLGSLRSARALIPLSDLGPSDVLQYVAHALYMIGHDLVEDDSDVEAIDGDDGHREDYDGRPYPALRMVRLLLPLVDTVGPVAMKQYIIALQINPFTVLRQAVVDTARKFTYCLGEALSGRDAPPLPGRLQRAVAKSAGTHHMSVDAVAECADSIVRWTDETGWRRVLDALLAERPEWLSLPAGDFSQRGWRLEHRPATTVVPTGTELAEARAATKRARDTIKAAHSASRVASVVAEDELLATIAREYADVVGRP
ncbi:hypothetical protein psal_cds_1340 [Pandoravirus salinus]|uniref:Uncharacterized protein n=1 Tax=Pandoravirus salinus TaxID=1349410 RepID=S4W5S0_9VIRU|nr:hypothetical protein psal_cds_1340 [Pandoravirus salinus]AGO85730.1 hypothetical protein psal_cds_1340 [Pandoravirus salinus]